jgi:tetratricopeptide (TPR) repeat protein
VLDLQTEQHELGQSYLELYEAVVDLKRRHDLHPCAVHPRDGLALRRESEREVVQDLVKRFRNLPPEQQRKLPALLNSLAQLEVVVGEIEAGQQDFQEVARLVADPISQAEAHHNVYRAALERRDWNDALAALRRAVALDLDAFEPFPFSRFEPQRILGAGGFGVTFLCLDRKSETTVVVKSLRPDSLDRDMAALSREFGLIQELDHPNLIRIREHGHADAELTRPYVVLENFEGQTLADHVAANGPLTPEDWLQIAWPIARALQALHGRGALHRSLRPNCVLIRAVPPSVEEDEEVSEEKTEDQTTRWHVKILDAGLSIKRGLIHASSSNPAAQVQTSLGRSVARTIAYQPSEVVGRPKGHVWVGPHSDIYSFGKLCCFALTGRADPDSGDRVILSDGWNKLLNDLTAWILSQRPNHIGLVLDRLSNLAGPGDLITRIERQMYAVTIRDHTETLALEPDNIQALINRGNAYARQSDFDRAIVDFTQALELNAASSEANTAVRAGLYRRRALAHSRANKVDLAIADYTEAIRLEPRNIEALANRGLAYSQKNEYDQAIADYTEALKINPRDEAILYNRGNAHYCKAEYDLAVADYSEVVRLDPKHAWAFGNRGKAHALRGEHNKAILDFTRVLQLDPANIKALWDRALAYTDVNQHDRAIVDYTEAIRQQPSAGLYVDRGLAHANRNRLEEAVADFTEALSLDPKNGPAFMFRGNAHSDRNELKEALDDLNEAVRLSSPSAVALYNRANVQARLGATDEAIRDYTDALAIDPNYLSAMFNRGNVYADRQEYDEAVIDYTALLERNPRDGAALTNRGNAYSSLCDLELALADYSQAIALEAGDVITLLNRANTNARLRRLDDALADYTEALKVDPSHGRAYNSRGNLYAEMGDSERALNDYNESIRLTPDFARAYHNRANVLAQRGEQERALADYNKAIELAADYIQAWFNRGVLHAERGDDEAAIADFTEVIRLNPDHAGAFNNRGKCHWRRGDQPAALDDFDAAIDLDGSFAEPLFNRAQLFFEQGESSDALADLDVLLLLTPADIDALHARARVQARMGNYEKAMADNREVLRLAPENARACNNLAWLLAVCPAAELRHPQEAVDLSRKACELTSWQNAYYLDTHAAALAAQGGHQEAAQRQQQAVDLAGEEHKADFRMRLELYQAGKAYQEAAAEPGE